MTAWTLLFFAGLFEIGFVACLKLSGGMKHLGWAAASLTLGFFSFLNSFATFFERSSMSFTRIEKMAA